MDWREFVASIVGSLAWPVSVAVVVLLLRRQIRALLEGRIKSLRAGPVLVEFWEEKVVEVGASIALGEVAAAGPPGTPSRPETQPSGEEAWLEHAAALAEKVPVVAVIDSFRLVLARLEEIAVAAGLPDMLPATVYADMLQREGLITAAQESAIRGLVVLRRVAGNDDGSGLAVTVEQARDFVQLARGVLRSLARPPAA